MRLLSKNFILFILKIVSEVLPILSYTVVLFVLLKSVRILLGMFRVFKFSKIKLMFNLFFQLFDIRDIIMIYNDLM